jgi:hypothetical protein
LTLQQTESFCNAFPDNHKAKTTYHTYNMAPAFNNARIADHEDKLLLARIDEYFEAFAVADAKKMDSMVAEDYRMSDIGKS